MIGYVIAGLAALAVLKKPVANTDTSIAANANATGVKSLSTVATAANSPGRMTPSFATLDPYLYSDPHQIPAGEVIQNAHPVSGVVYPWVPIPRVPLITNRSPSTFAVAPGQQNPLIQSSDPTTDPWLPPTKITVETQQAGSNSGSRFGLRTNPNIGPGSVGDLGLGIMPPSRPVATPRITGPVAIAPVVPVGAPVRIATRGITPSLPVSGRPTAQGIPPSKLATLYGGNAGSADFSGVFSHGSFVG